LEALAKDLSVFVEALRQTQGELRKEFVEAVNFTMNTLWQIIYPYQNFIGVRLGVEEGDYVLQLQDRTLQWVDAEGAPSGGERSIACLVLRIAFARVLAPHLRMLVLDEPTANLDSNAVKLLAETLRENMGEIMEQAFIITHDDTFEEAVTGNAYRFDRDKQSDGVTKIIQIS
jgi:DNA repair exonuclease SbcCD ATPase subunit